LSLSNPINGGILVVNKRGRNQQRIFILIMDLSSKGLDEEELERLLQHHMKVVSVILKFSSI
jgi:hypothetical protein